MSDLDPSGPGSSEPSSSGGEATGTPKKSVSATRNIIGLIALIAVVTVGGFEYKAKSQYNAAVTAINSRLEDESRDLMTPAEAEGLIGVAPDGPAAKTVEGIQTFTTQNYSWRGPIKTYTLTAFYTLGPHPGLHHFKTEGAAENPADPLVKPMMTRGPRPNPPAKEAPKKQAPPATNESKAAPATKDSDAPPTKDSKDTKASDATPAPKTSN
jgi:hypothetical protein